jgi:FtsZ-binding cell division protein ZapB
VKDSQIKYLKEVIDRLEAKLEQKIETIDVKKYDFSIINDLNELLLDHRERPSYDVLVMKLEAFRDLNLKMVVQ